MEDPDGIVETFFWTPPSGDIPPVTITISSTVTPMRDAQITEAPKEPVKPPEPIPQTPQHPGESLRIPVETPRLPVEVPQSSQPAQPSQKAPQPSSTPSQVTPQEVFPTTPPTAPTSSANVAFPSTRTGSPAPTGSPFSTLITLTNPWTRTPTAQATSASTAAVAPTSRTNKGLVIGLCSGGFALVAALLAVMLYLRYRRNQAIYRRKVIKSQIGNPVAPPPPSYLPAPVRSTRVREMAPMMPIPLRTHTHTPTRAVSSVYDDQGLHARDTLGSFSGTPYEWAALEHGPFDPPPQPLQPRPSRNLMSASRRSSLLSNYRPRMDDERGSWGFGGLDTVGEGHCEEDSLWEARRRLFET